jgi:hypothetical protein
MKSRYALLLKLFLVLNIQCAAFQKSVSKDGILQGKVRVFSGNCMPAPGEPPCEPAAVSTTIYITKLSAKYDRELLINAIQSSDDGLFHLTLPEGAYSVFVQNGTEVVCTLVQCPSVCYCSPFTITSDSSTVIDLIVNNATW